MHSNTLKYQHKVCKIKNVQVMNDVGITRKEQKLLKDRHELPSFNYLHSQDQTPIFLNVYQLSSMLT